MIRRRDAMIRLGHLGLGAMTLPTLLQAEETFGAAAKRKARSCILIYLWGGPPQMDMWDPNPDAPDGVRSLFKPIATTIPGIHVAEKMPRFAQLAKKTAIIRTVSHDSNAHEPSVYRTLTGRKNTSLRVPRNDRKRSDAPNVGSVVSYFRQGTGMPAAVTIPRPIGHEGITYSGTYAGFLGGRHDPMEVAPAGESKSTAVHPLSLRHDLDETRMLARQGLLKTIQNTEQRLQQLPAARDLTGYREQALNMICSPAAKKAFRIELEKDKTRDRYGRNEWGEAILMARRLVEAGVRLVTISWMYIQKSGNVANIWDNHGPFEGKTGYQMLEAVYGLPTLDRAYAALLEDLESTGLLDETLVAMYGEFGRTPKINKATGRDHWGACQSAVLAGGGIRGGQVWGESDRDSAYPKSDPVSPEDLLATIYDSMGISPHADMRDQFGRPHRVVDGQPLRKLF